MNSTKNTEESSALTLKGLCDFRQEVERRIRIGTHCAENEHFREIEYELCAKSVEHFINNWCWTFDPRVIPANLPFKLFDCQVELLRWIESVYEGKENGLVEKSRDMGASWVFVCWFVHHMLFHPGFVGLLGSRKQELVDDGTEDSLFGKIRYVYRRLPSWLRPQVFVTRMHDNFLRFANPENNSKIGGESANPDFGRAGRASAVLLDEAASIPKSESVLAAVKSVSPVVFFLSSPKGKSNAFYRLRHNSRIKVFSLHWSKDPRKDTKWYEDQKEILLPWEVGQELDLSYDVETGEKIYSRFSRQWHVAKEKIICNPDFEQWVSWDFGRAGAMALLFGQITDRGVVQIFQTYEYTGYDIDFFIPIAKGRMPPEYRLLPSADKKTLDEALKKIPLRESVYDQRHYGDHAGTARTANSKRSCKDALEDAKIDLITSGKQTYDWRIKCTDNLLRLKPVDAEHNIWRSKFQVSPDCTRFIDCMNNYINSPAAINRGEVAPVINWASHQVTAFEFFAINRFPITSSTPSVQERGFR